MIEVGTFEAKNKLSALLDRVEAGEQVVITRNGKRVARLVRDDESERHERARMAMTRLAELRKGLTLDGLSIRDLIAEGRR